MEKKENKIKGVLITFISERDRYGNCYLAWRYIDTLTGKVAEGRGAGGESNIRGIILNFCGNSWTGADRYIEIRQVLNQREFKHLIKDMPYGGNTGEDMVRSINEQFFKEKGDK